MNRVKILIVEDNPITAMEVRDELEKMGHVVTGITTHYDASLLSIAKNTPEIVLLDIQLKKTKDGIELAHAIRKRQLPIDFIYLTNYNDEKTVNRAAQTGPIGYINKPFRTEDLKVGLQMALYKKKINSTPSDERIELANGYSYDAHYQMLYNKDEAIRISEKERILLDILISSKGSVVPYGVLEEYLWGGNPPDAENTLRTLVYRLKQKIELDIEAVVSVGYKLLF